MDDKVLTIGEALPQEIKRVEGLIALYASVSHGCIAAVVMQEDVNAARKAMDECDLEMMIRSYQNLKEYKE
jgi:hypothetical protein